MNFNEVMLNQLVLPQSLIWNEKLSVKMCTGNSKFLG